MDEKNLDVNESTEEEINLALEQALVRCKELEDAHARAIADYRNLERRTEEGRLELRRLTTASVIINLLPIYDDLTRAFEAIDPDIQKHDWVSGISLIHEKFRGVITSTGAIEIDALNQPLIHHLFFHNHHLSVNPIFLSVYQLMLKQELAVHLNIICEQSLL